MMMVTTAIFIEWLLLCHGRNDEETIAQIQVITNTELGQSNEKIVFHTETHTQTVILVQWKG